MVTISDEMLCLFSGHVEQRNGSYVIEVPKHELSVGQVRDGTTYRVALLPVQSTETQSDTTGSTQTGSTRERSNTRPGPPVTSGEQRDVEIVDIGEQGDGIARVERGYVIIVPDTEMGERVTIEITNVKENLAFAEVVERLSYYD